MKTIKQIADEIGVTKAALQKRIGRGSLYTRLSPYISVQNGTKYIDETGENIIKEVFTQKPSVKSVDIPVDMVSMDGDIPISPGVDSLLVELLREQMEDLRQQLNVKDRLIDEQQQTIRELAATNKSLSDSINTAHHNELAETIIDGRDKLAAPAPEKVSLWNRIFRKKD